MGTRIGPALAFERHPGDALIIRAAGVDMHDLIQPLASNHRLLCACSIGNRAYQSWPATSHQQECGCPAGSFGIGAQEGSESVRFQSSQTERTVDNSVLLLKTSLVVPDSRTVNSRIYKAETKISRHLA